MDNAKRGYTDMQRKVYNRIAGLLSCCLQRYFGLKTGALKVENFGSCDFNPKKFVGRICEIYPGGVEVFVAQSLTMASLKVRQNFR